MLFLGCLFPGGGLRRFLSGLLRLGLLKFLSLRGGLDIDLKAGQTRGQTGVLALLADGPTQLVVQFY